MSAQEGGKDSRDGQDGRGPRGRALTEQEREVLEFMEGMRREREEAGHEEGRNHTPAPAPVDAAQVEAAVNGDLQEWATNALMTSRFSHRHYQRAADVANRMGGSSHLREALTALDAADWDVGGAMQQLEHDAELRQFAAAAGPEPNGPDPNRGLDRARASGGPNWDKSKLQLQIRVGKRWKFRNYMDVDWTLGFDANNPSSRDLLRLNRWRHRQIIDLAGPPRRPRGVNAGDWWHPTTIRDLRHRIKPNLKRIVQNHKAQPDYTGIASAHNQLFNGVQLPGQVHEVPERNYDQTAATINRYWKQDKYKKLGKRVQAEKGLKAIRKEERKERKRCEKTEQRDFSSTLEDLDAVDKETLVLESDWEEEESDDEDD